VQSGTPPTRPDHFGLPGTLSSDPFPWRRELNFVRQLATGIDPGQAGGEPTHFLRAFRRPTTWTCTAPADYFDL
jgi:hypothetical protein